MLPSSLLLGLLMFSLLSHGVSESGGAWNWTTFASTLGENFHSASSFFSIATTFSSFTDAIKNYRGSTVRVFLNPYIYVYIYI